MNLCKEGYLIIDLARIGVDLETLRSFDPLLVSLYEGKTLDELGDVSPCITKYKSDTKFGKKFLKVNGTIHGVS